MDLLIIGKKASIYDLKDVLNEAEKVKQQEKDIIELFTKVDSESRYFVIKIDKSSGGMLAEFSKDLEVLLRANDVLLSKNLMTFLNRVIENEQLDLPINLFSESPVSRKLRPRQPQIA